MQTTRQSCWYYRLNIELLFTKVPEIFTCDKNRNENGNTSELGYVYLGKVGADNETDSDLCLDSTFKN